MEMMLLGGMDNTLVSLIEPRPMLSALEVPPALPAAIRKRAIAAIRVDMHKPIVMIQRLTLAEANHLCFAGRYCSGIATHVEADVNRFFEAKQLPAVVGSMTIGISDHNT